MRVIFVLDGTYPEGMAASARVRAYGRGLCANGVETLVLVPEARIPRGGKSPNALKSGVDSNGVRFRCFGGLVRSSSFIVRQLMDVIGSVRTLVWLLFHLRTDDFVVVYEGGMCWQRAVAAVTHLRGCRAGVELNELPYVYEEVSGGDARRAALKDRYFRTVLPRFDFVLSISAALSELVRRWAPKAAVIEIPILVVNPEPALEEAVFDFPYIFHCGALTRNKDGIYGALNAFALAVSGRGVSVGENPAADLHYVLTGSLEKASEADAIARLLDEKGLRDRVHFLGYVDSLMLRRCQAGCAMCIINKLDTLQNRYCFPTKLGEYLAYSRPVITTSVGEAARHLKDGVNAWVVAPDDTSTMAEAVLSVLSDPERASAVASAGHSLVLRDFNPQLCMADVISKLESL